MFNRRLFFSFTLGLVIFLGLSLVGYLYPLVNTILTLVIVATTLILTFYRPAVALLLVLAELLVGSFGYALAASFNGQIVSLRLGLFLVILVSWLVQLIIELVKNKKLINFGKFWRSQWRNYFLALSAIFIFAVVWGLVRGNALANVFFDANAWLFFLYLLPVYDWWDKKTWPAILNLLLAGVATNFILTFLVFLIFTQNSNLAPIVYDWLRDARLMEITHVSGNWWRVFGQSQIFTVALMPFFTLLMFPSWLDFNRGEKFNRWASFGLLISSFVVVVSLSRSFWLGAIFSFIFLVIWLIKNKASFRKIILILIFIGVLCLSEFAVLNLLAGAGGGELLGGRLNLGEAAGVSRFNQLTPLLDKIKIQPLLGLGLGTTFTYQSQDPRILAVDPNGWRTTYASEWGYLDIILKFGLLGLAIYLLLIWQIIKKLPARNATHSVAGGLIKNHLPAQSGELGVVNLGLALGLVAIVVVNIFSPYLNHPLGIGYLVLLMILSES